LHVHVLFAIWKSYHADGTIFLYTCSVNAANFVDILLFRKEMSFGKSIKKTNPHNLCYSDIRYSILFLWEKPKINNHKLLKRDTFITVLIVKLYHFVGGTMHLFLLWQWEICIMFHYYNCFIYTMFKYVLYYVWFLLCVVST